MCHSRVVFSEESVPILTGCVCSRPQGLGVLHAWDGTPSSGMCSANIFSVCGLSFHFVNSVDRRAEWVSFLILMKLQFIHLWISPLLSWPKSHKGFLTCSGSVTVPGFAFCSMIHFESSLVFGKVRFSPPLPPLPFIGKTFHSPAELSLCLC